MASRAHAFLLLSAAMASLIVGSTAGIFHIVGAGKGWRVPPNETFYAEWALTRNISIGDKLMFLYRSGVYNIVEVSNQQEFDACSMSNVTDRYHNGPTIVELTEPGPHYYFCGVGKHCEAGQKLAINVSAVAPPPPEAPSPTSHSWAGPSTSPNAIVFSAGLVMYLALVFLM